MWTYIGPGFANFLGEERGCAMAAIAPKEPDSAFSRDMGYVIEMSGREGMK